MERWERRERKLQAKRKRMGMSGRGLITLIQPIIQKKAREAKRAAEERSKPARGASSESNSKND